MPVTPTFPGVYIEEIPSGVHTIAAVATSIGAFIDYFTQGPLNQAVEILSLADFNRFFGGLDANSEVSYAITQFFLNGGTQAYVVRVTSATTANAATTAAIVIQDGSSNNILQVSAASAGAWENNLGIDIDLGTTDSTKLFNLTVIETDTSTPPKVIATENVTLDNTQSNYAVNVVNNNSQTHFTAGAAPQRFQLPRAPYRADLRQSAFLGRLTQIHGGNSNRRCQQKSSNCDRVDWRRSIGGNAASVAHGRRQHCYRQ